MEKTRVQITPYHIRLRYAPEIERQDADIIFEFFIVYSRFEYALKLVGYRNSDSGYLKPDWEAFINSTQEKFTPNHLPELSEAFQYYLEHPPRIQILCTGRLDWRPNRRRENESDYAWVIRSVGIVRNNLFHGGKFPYDAIRDTILLSFGLIILYHCLELDDEVFKAFNYPS